jgi:Methylase of polypeptide chain release factors
MVNGSNLAGGNPKNGRVADDFYATAPQDTQVFIKAISEVYDLHDKVILEPSAGQGHIIDVLQANFPDATVIGRDLVDRGRADIESGVDYLQDNREEHIDVVLTNPPFAIAKEFIDKSLEKAPLVMMFAKLQFLEGVKRYEWFKHQPLKYVYVYSYRATPWRDGQPLNENGKRWASTMTFAWFVFEKGYSGEPVIRWLNKE